MSVGLPEMVYADGIRKSQTVKFSGYNHNLYAGDGEIWDMENMSSDHLPLLSPRKPRYLVRTMEQPNGFCARDRLFWADGTKICTDGSLVVLTPESGKKRFVGMGNYIVILPDMMYLNMATGARGFLEASWHGAVQIQDGTYAGVEADANTIYAEGADWGKTFREGDAVTITGCTVHPENNKTPIIREIDGDYLHFYENVFTIAEGGDTENVTIARTVPKLDYVCENENRLWGCSGDTIYASKLGDPFNWNVFDGLATDSFTVDVGSAGDFTGCCSYLGYPCFFKEEHIYKVYGDRPSNFQAMGCASLGVAQGSHDSLAIAGEVLFYLSRTGIVAYTGGTPQSVAAAFGDERYKNAVGGSDGIRYFVSMEDMEGRYHLFVYDTRYGVWHREDAIEAVGFGWMDGMYMLDSEGHLWLRGDAATVPEEAQAEETVSSMVEFGDFVEKDPNKKGTSKLQIRMELEEGASVTVSMQFDSDGVWRKVKTITAAKKRSYYLPIIPRRSDHFRIRFEGTGQWSVYSLVRESYSGSEL